MVNPSHPDYPKPTSVAVSKVMKGNKGSDTMPEVIVRSLLHRKGFRFRKNYVIKIGDRRHRPDIVFTKKRAVIFIDGCFWHFCPEHGHIPKSNTPYWKKKLIRNSQRDAEDTLALQEEGWLVIRIWEHVPINEALQTILKSLGQR